MILYRGDRSQWARDSRMAGILTRMIDGGNPATVSAVGLLEAARAHIKPSNDAERLFLKRTSFLSFSEVETIAARFALGKGNTGVLAPCPTKYGEDTTIFELNTSGMVNSGRDGVFVLDYPCDMKLAEPLAEGIEYEGQPAAARCEYCDPTNRLQDAIRVDAKGRLLHRIQLLNVPVFLRGHSERERYAGALANAIRDREWLVYPTDYVDRLKGPYGLVQLSPIWRARRYVIVPDGGSIPAPPRKIIVPGE